MLVARVGDTLGGARLTGSVQTEEEPPLRLGAKAAALPRRVPASRSHT